MTGFAYPKNFVKYIDIFRNRYFRYENLVGIFNNLFPDGHRGKSVLDIGCGTGTFAIAMADAGYDVLGIDGHDESIDLARERSWGRSDVRFEAQDFRNIKLGERKFDLITELHIPIAIEDMRETLAMYRDHLKEDGFIAHIYLRKSANVVTDDKLELDQHVDPDGEFKLVRFNQWILNGLSMRVFFVALIEEDGKNRMEFDKAKLELVAKGERVQHELYREVADIPTHNLDSTPPWSEEFIQVLQHK